ncbi:MAG: ribosome biogenesis GTPase YlqF [Bacillota bacterium]|nr:ribosome biogenesis GTPase YlqF [Bacillota bacterium]
MSTLENINWYPGHMKKTRELIQENLKLVDVVCEIIDARIPISSRNPIINDIVGNKSKIIILNKSDLADKEKTKVWAEKLRNNNTIVLILNANSGEGVNSLKKLLEKIRDEKNEGKPIKKSLRLMIVGIPNVGKSSLINRLVGSRAAKAGNKPGVTKGKQWIKLGEDIMLLDTPGILWPKFEDPNVGLNLAFCGSIKDEIMDLSDLGLELIGHLCKEYPSLMQARYKLDSIEETPLENMEAIALKRGFILPGKRIDYERTARTVIDEFRAGTIGSISLE